MREDKPDAIDLTSREIVDRVEITEEAFEDLDAPVKRITAPDTPVPYSPPLEDAFRPNAAKIAAALRDLAAEIGRSGRCFITEAGAVPGLPSALVLLAADHFDQFGSIAVRVGAFGLGGHVEHLVIGRVALVPRVA